MKGQCFFRFWAELPSVRSVALLLAPDSGQNTRHKIVDKIKHGEQKVKDAVEGGIVRPQTTVNPP